MDYLGILNSKSVKRSVKSLFVFMCLFIVLSFGVVAIVLLRGCKNQYPKDKILWISDGQNNIYSERIALEFHGICIKSVPNTIKALELLEKDDNYVTVIYDINSNDSANEKKEFINKIKNKNIKIPIFTHDRY